MNQAWIVLLVTAACVLTADLITAYLRRRARRISVSQEALTGNDPDKMEGVYKKVYDFIHEHNKELTYDKFKTIFSTETFTMLINYLQVGIEPAETKKIMDEAIINIEEKKAQNVDNGNK